MAPHHVRRSDDLGGWPYRCQQEDVADDVCEGDKLAGDIKRYEVIRPIHESARLQNHLQVHG